MTIAPPVDLAPRTTSFDVDAFPLPTGREEEWRFAPMEALREFLELQADVGSVQAVSAGGFVANRPDGVLQWWAPTNRPAAIARAQASNVVVVDIRADTRPDGAVVVNLRADAPQSAQHVEIRLGRFSAATVVVNADTAHDVAGAIVVDVADGADLTLVTVIDGDVDHRLVCDIPARIGRDARLSASTIALGGRIVRLLPSVRYAAPGGSAEMLGAFLVGEGQFLEQRIFVEHEEPHCRSRVLYKGALSGATAHSVWIGDVLVRRTAIGTDTYELNRNLLLTDGPRADSVPNLELETGDVAGAGHASATGRFDDDQLFYLMSRGIDRDRARQLVVRGFFADVVGRIPSPEWRVEVMARIEQRLGLEPETDTADD